MSQSLVDKVVEAVLYEGYVLYPYRPSVKNRQRTPSVMTASFAEVIALK